MRAVFTLANATGVCRRTFIAFQVAMRKAVEGQGKRTAARPQTAAGARRASRRSIWPEVRNGVSSSERHLTSLAGVSFPATPILHATSVPTRRTSRASISSGQRRIARPLRRLCTATASGAFSRMVSCSGEVVSPSLRTRQTH